MCSPCDCRLPQDGPVCGLAAVQNTPSATELRLQIATDAMTMDIVSKRCLVQRSPANGQRPARENIPQLLGDLT
ncbi:hypothetical protein KUF71_008102 [Frankliniella fusca]|uniref:Uncharacterized protein n=1 Tax=Frankliniella fusca TaxID=407009 RepID=A0AAE1HCD6_9NEOP|nr:hypothetical protein KUF71_008102 [Frankliniella fusca]